MRPLPAHLREFIECPGFRDGRLTRLDVVPILEALGNSEHPNALGPSLRYLRSRDPETAEAAAVAVDRLMRANVPDRVGAVTERLRSYLHWTYAGTEPTPPELEHLANYRDVAVSLLGAASFHPSGYVREWAVFHLSFCRAGDELPYLLLRTIDWVPQVRQAAMRALAERMRPEYAAHFVRNLPVLDRCRGSLRAGKGGAQGIFDAIEDLLRSPEGQSALREGFRSRSLPVRRASFRIAAAGAGAQLVETFATAMMDRDPSIQLWAGRRAMEKLSGEALMGLLPRMKAARAAHLRAFALEIMADRSLPGASDAILNALLDPSASVRERARWYCTKQGLVDAATFYRETLPRASGAELEAVVAGLGETGSSGDAAALLPLLANGANRVRRAVTKAVGRLDPGGCRELLLQLLADERPGISREAREALLRVVHSLDDRLLGEMVTQGPLHVSRNALSLLEHMSRWRGLPHLLRALRHGDGMIVAQAMNGLDHWIESSVRTYTAPSADQLREVDSALAQAGVTLPEPKRVQLEQVIGFWRSRVAG